MSPLGSRVLHDIFTPSVQLRYSLSGLPFWTLHSQTLPAGFGASTKVMLNILEKNIHVMTLDDEVVIKKSVCVKMAVHVLTSAICGNRNNSIIIITIRILRLTQSGDLLDIFA